MVALMLSTSACGGRVLVGSPSLETPMLVGPIERIGDKAPRREANKVLAVGTWETDSSVDAVSLRSTTIEGDYEVTRAVNITVASTAVEGEDAARSWRRAGKPSDAVVYVDELVGTAYVCNFLFYMCTNVGWSYRATVTAPK